MLNAPDYTRTCTCSYQVVADLALVHLPDGALGNPQPESWSFDHLSAPEKPTPVRRVGLNFGAPGNRLSDDGTLGLEWPSVGGPSPELSVHVQGDNLELFRRHMSTVESASHGALPWVAASGMEGVTGLAIRPFVQTTGPGKDATVNGFERHWETNALATAHDGVADRNEPARRYTVRLHFLEPGAAEPGERVFDVSINGRVVLKSFDIAARAGGANRAIVEEYAGVRVVEDLRIAFTPRSGNTFQPVICGIEALATGE